MAVRFHIRQSWDGKKWYPIPGTDQPERGDITLAFDVDPSRSAAVRFLLSHITSVAMFGGLSSVYSRPWIGWALILWGLVVLAFFGYSANFLYFHHEEYPIRSFILNAAWIVGVPLYFFSEHFLFYYFGNPLQYDQFKRVQDLAAKIWVGAIAVLAAILAVKLH
jgi:hypothetical protein